ncbi:hypothetical protein LUZ60_010025 [Juncus effusus]|nr:hypothetical protein LUZ60_010025 [Juncus effusus]
MKHNKSESDVTSLATSSPPRSPKRAMYYVQSPSRDSHDGDKSASSMQPTPVYNSPMDSPSHPSFEGGTHHSRASSASRFSGNLRSSSSRKGQRNNKRMNEKGWPECNVIREEGSYDDLDEDEGLSRKCQVILGFLGFVFIFTFFCLIIWGAARPYKPDVIIKSLVINNFYEGEGTDNSGVPTKLITMNCTLKLNILNHASMFGIHASSDSIRLIFSEITIATGELKRYYQPRKSHRAFSLILHGEKVPLYGAGAGLSLSTTTTGVPVKVPLTLDFLLKSKGYVIGKLVKVSHNRHISCPISVNPRNSKPIKFSHNSCSYD